MRKKSTVWDWIFRLLVLFLFWGPLAYGLLLSVKLPDEAYLPFTLSEITWNFYRAVWNFTDFTSLLLNSIFLAGMTTYVSVSIGLPAAYALSQFAIRPRTRILVMAILFAIVCFPRVAVISGLFEMLSLTRLYDTLVGLVLVNLINGVPFAVLVMMYFMKDLPKSLAEAAMLDGCNPLEVLIAVIAPVMRPVSTAVGVVIFIETWKEVMFAMTFSFTEETRTVSVGTLMIFGGPFAGIDMAGSAIVSLPVLLLILIYQKRIIAGLTRGIH